jgi:hypothetical protein
LEARFWREFIPGSDLQISENLFIKSKPDGAIYKLFGYLSEGLFRILTTGIVKKSSCARYTAIFRLG